MPQRWCGWNEAEGGVLLESPWERSRKCSQEVGVWCGNGVRKEWDSITGANELCGCQELQRPSLMVPWITSHEEDPHWEVAAFSCFLHCSVPPLHGLPPACHLSVLSGPSSSPQCNFLVGSPAVPTQTCPAGELLHRSARNESRNPYQFCISRITSYITHLCVF